MRPEFLTIEDVLRIYEIELAGFGGMTGVSVYAFSESALAQPMAAFGGELLHVDLVAMAAAYLFYIVKNHPFLDGKKRTGLIVAVTFLAINGSNYESLFLVPVPYTARRSR
jgi:death-on-curing protein